MAKDDQRSEAEFRDLNATGRTDMTARIGDIERSGSVGQPLPGSIVAEGSYGGGNGEYWRDSSLERSTSVRKNGKRR